MADANENKEELDVLSQELEMLCHKCVKQGQEWNSIRKAASPFMKDNYKLRKSQLVKIAFVICVFATVLSFRPCRRYMSAVISQISISVLPMWDWRWIHGVACAWGNPYLEDQGRQLETLHCQICSELSQIPRLYDANSQLVAEKYLDNDIPVVVEDINSPASAIDDVIKLFLADKVLRLYTSCDFESSIDVPGSDHRQFLQQLKKGQHTSYYVHWTNCFRESAKLFRGLYKRPEFLPSSLELTEVNWLFMSAMYTEEIDVELPIEENVIMLLQLEGSLNVTLTPKQICETSCSPLDVTLNQGSTLIVSDFLYEVTYQPSQESESITVGLGASFD